MAMLRDHVLTRHVTQRMQQRGLRAADLRLLLDEASQVAPDTLLLTERDAERAIRTRKREIQDLERLKGTKAVVEEGVIVTCCHSTQLDQKRVLRRGKRNASKAW